MSIVKYATGLVSKLSGIIHVNHWPKYLQCTPHGLEEQAESRIVFAYLLPGFLVLFGRLW